MNPIASFTGLPDRELLAEVKRLAEGERHATAALVASLAEMDARRLYLGEGCSSLFTYCTQVLQLSEHAAYGRIEAARAARRFPLVLQRLADGDITLTAVSLLRPHLTDDNCRDLLAAARHKSKRDVEKLVVARAPRPDAPAVVRRLPSPKAAASDTAPVTTAARPLPPPAQEARVAAPMDAPILLAQPAAQGRSPLPLAVPLAPERFKIQFTVGHETHDKLRRAQDLLRHAVPNGDPAEIFDRALTLLVAHLEKTKLAEARRPRDARRAAADSRHVPARVRRAVWRRDAGRCAFVGREGRCTETALLEFHHVEPFARGGTASVDNIQLRCRAHNQFEAAEAFGPLLVREWPITYSPAIGNLHSAIGNEWTRSGPSRTEMAYGSCRTCGRTEQRPQGPWKTHKPRFPQLPQAPILHER